MKELIFGLIIANMGVYSLLAYEANTMPDSCSSWRSEAVTWQKQHPGAYLPKDLAERIIGCLGYDRG